MTLNEFALIGGGGAVTGIIVALFKAYTDRQAVTSAERQRQRDGESSVQVAAITSFSQLVSSYQKDIAEMRREISDMRARETALETKLNGLAEANRKLIRHYEKALDYIELQHAQLVKTHPEWPASTLPRDPNSFL